MKPLTPVRIQKSTSESHAGIDASTSKPPPSAGSGKAEAQLVEVEPGVYDIIFQCQCGQKATIRCESLE